MLKVLAGAVLAAAPLVSGCGVGGGKVVPLLDAAGVPMTPERTVPLEVVTRSTAVRDPLPLHGTGIVYGDIEAAVGHAVSSATVPWADEHRKHPRPGDGWQLVVELVNARADYEDGRILFTLDVRATLRARAGNVYLAQTQASCRQGGIVAADEGAPVMYRCMMEVGHDIDGWLDGVDLDAVASSH
jgi:hypothetical protein